MSVDGGGRINYSPSVAAVGATAAQSIYYMPQNDLQVTAYHSRGVEAGSMRGYGTLQSMASTEMMVDEIAGRLGVDAIDLRAKRPAFGHEKHPGRGPGGALRLHEILDKAAVHEVWKNRDAIKKQREAADPDTGMASGSPFARKTSAPAPKRRWPASNSPPKAASPCATSASKSAPACRLRKRWWWPISSVARRTK
jgi:CO/xanthine dehydrogenase Mo-binding subunit